MTRSEIRSKEFRSADRLAIDNRHDPRADGAVAIAAEDKPSAVGRPPHHEIMSRMLDQRRFAAAVDGDRDDVALRRVLLLWNVIRDVTAVWRK